MMAVKTKKISKPATFSDYKLLKDEIIEISEQRFENILNRKFDDFRRNFKAELMGEINLRLDSMESKSDSRFASMDTKIDSLEKRITLLTWLIPVIITFIMLAFKVIEKH